MALISLGPWGGPGGGSWSYKPNSGITEIVLRVDDNVKSISFKDACGQASKTFGGERDKRGEVKKIEIKWPSEYLKSISGTYRNYGGNVVIISLSFITNLKTYGRFGADSGEHFSIPIADSQVVGFHGRSGDYIDAIAIFVKPAPHSNGSISLGPWASPGGHYPFSFTVPARSWIKEITVHHGNCIYSLSFKDSDGTTYGKFGGNNPSDAGEEKIVEIKGNSERLSTITGTYGVYKGYVVIKSLSFITNRNKYGPFGDTTGTPFSVPIEGSVVNGFHGRTGYYVDALGIFVIPKKTF